MGSEKRVLAFFRQGFLEVVDVYEAFGAADLAFVLSLMAAELILSGEDTEAVYMMFLYTLAPELAFREPKRLREILVTSRTIEQVRARCIYTSLLLCARSRSQLIEYMIECSEISPQNGLADLLRALQEEIPQGRAEVLLYSFEEPDFFLSKLIRITLANANDGSESNTVCDSYSDVTLGWWLKLNTEHLGNYYRVVHNGRSLFLSSSGKKTLSYLGIKNGDELVIGGVCHPDNNSSDVSEKASKPKPAAKMRHMKPKRATKKHRKSPQGTPHVLSDKQLAEQHKQEHSQSMNPVLEELDPRLKYIRNQLNKLALKNKSPKVRGHATTRTDVSRAASTVPLADEHLAKKAGKVAYPILVGEASNLYKTSKMPHGHLVAIDLHGCSKEEALEKLDNSLPVWVNAAMRGSAPWVLGVDIICGGGSQILSEAVKGWIRANAHAANRPKGFV